MKKTQRRRRKSLSSPPSGADRAGEPAAAGGVRISQIQKFQGPLPPPQLLRGYEGVIPGAAERILAMAEREQSAGHELAKNVVSQVAADMRRGQYLGLMTVLAALGVASFLGYLGHALAAGTVGGTTVCGLAALFAMGRRGASAQPPGPEQS